MRHSDILLTPRARRATAFRSGALLSVLTLAVAACGGAAGNGDPMEPDNDATATRIEVVSGDGQTAAVDQALADPIVVRAVTAAGAGVAGVAIDFTVAAGGGSVAPASGTTDSSGETQATWTLGRTAGSNHRLRASGQGLTAATVSATAEAGPIATVEIDPANVQLGGVGATRELGAQATDEFGNPVPDPGFEWASADESIVTVDPNGVVTGVAFGSAEVTATAGGRTGTATVTVVDPSSLPSVSGVQPGTLEPGGNATITGENFGADISAVTVTVAGVEVQVDGVTPTEIQVTLPAQRAFPCDPTAPAAVTVDVAGLEASAQHPLRVANLRELEPGEATVLVDDAVASRCNEIADTGGRYLVTVMNTGTDGASSTPFLLRGATTGAGTAATQIVAAQSRVPRLGPRLRGELEERLGLRRAHEAVLRRNIALLERLKASGARPRTAPRAAPDLAAQAAAMAEGDTMSIRLPNLDADAGVSLCTDFETIRARVVAEGDRAIALEDIAGPLAGNNDQAIRTMVDEFDNRMFGILSTNFGDPFVLDPMLDANGKLLMVFTHRVNQFSEGRVLGFVFSGDLVPLASCGSSNEAEIFYAIAPNDGRSGFPSNGAGQFTAEQWRRTVRSTLIHESKHLVSFANRFADPDATGFETVWLEEATAHMAEELFGRSLGGYSRNGNVSYAQSVFCEVRVGPNFPQCNNRPPATLDNFVFLYNYMQEVESKSPLIDDTMDEEAQTFRGSGWMMLRWAIDQGAKPEPEFLTELTANTTLSGLANLADVSGTPFRKILAGFLLANALDDRPGFAGDAKYTHPSWDTRDIFQGLFDDFAGNDPPPFPDAFPLVIRGQSFGNFALNGVSIAGGTASYLELSGVQAGPQVIELQSPDGGTPSSSLKLAIVRLQ